MTDFSQPMRTFGAMHDACRKAGHPCAYWGISRDYLVVIGRTRDSDALDESNFRSTLKRLGGEGDDVTVERETHWACGWVEFILVRPGSPAAIEAADIREAIARSPILDDEDYSILEDERCAELWSNCYRPRERVEYIRSHSHSRAPGFRCLMAAVRGSWHDAANILHCPSDVLRC